MFPNINPKNMQKMMKQLGMKQEEIDADEVIIKTRDKQLIFTNPQVSKVNALGQETFQISGDYEEQELEQFNEDDINTVVEQTGCSKEQAKTALKEEGDLAKAILKLKKD